MLGSIRCTPSMTTSRIDLPLLRQGAGTEGELESQRQRSRRDRRDSPKTSAYPQAPPLFALSYESAEEVDDL